MIYPRILFLFLAFPTMAQASSSTLTYEKLQLFPEIDELLLKRILQETIVKLSLNAVQIYIKNTKGLVFFLNFLIFLLTQNFSLKFIKILSFKTNICNVNFTPKGTSFMGQGFIFTELHVHDWKWNIYQ